MESISINIASKEDLPEILNLQKEAYISEALIYNDFSIQPLHQTLNEIETEFHYSIFLKAEFQGKIIGSVRAYKNNNSCFIGKLIVEKTEQNTGLGQMLLLEIESKFPNAKEYELFTGEKSNKNLYLYHKLGYNITAYKQISNSLTIVIFKKENS